MQLHSPSVRALAAICLASTLGCADDKPGTTTDGPAPSTTDTSTDPTSKPSPTTDTGTLPTLPTPTDTGTPGLPACSPALALDADRVSAPPEGLVTLLPSGGTGAWSYALGGDALGTLDATSGFYLAASEPGAVDEIVLSDDGCVGTAVLSIETVPALSALPATTEVLPGTAFTVEAVGGTGAATCTLVEAGSGATLAGCAYTAGAGEGFDRVRVTDDGTGEVDEARITVSTDARVDLLGAESWVLPLGASFLPQTLGGSGELTLTADGTVVDAQGGLLLALTEGATTVTVADRFAGFSADVPVEVVAPHVPPSDWYGPQTQLGHAEAADLDGDGFTDVVFALVEINDGAYYTGGAVIYAGTATGLDPDPVWQISGRNAYSYLGRSLRLDDIDGDGELDLLVGADGADFTHDDVGEVQVFLGQPGSFPDTTPTYTLRGLIGGDRAGSALTSCDLDDDGYVDIIAGAWAAEDRDLEGYPNSMGALMVYAGGPNGPDLVPTQVRYGYLPVDGDWAPVADVRIGEYGLAAGDVNGDGLCDLAVGSYTRSVDPDDTDNYGLVMVYEGQTAGMLTDLPTRIYANETDSYAELGREIALADLDDDGLDDVFAAAAYMDGDAGGSVGQVAIWLASSDDGRPSVEPVWMHEADRYVTGRKSSDYLGRDLEVVDRTGDGVLDVVVGEPNGQDTLDTVSNIGRISVWSGAELLALPDGGSLGEDDPAEWFLGLEGNEFTGQAFALLPDLDGDGSGEAFTFAGRSDALGTNVGEPRLIYSDGSHAALAMPGGPSGHDHGRSVVIFDADDDGVDDLIVGSPEDGDPVFGNNTGSVTMFAGLGHGSFGSTGERLGAYGTRGGGDRFGDKLATTDFDGDGIPDLVVSARNDTSLADLDDTRYANPTECAPADNIGGAGMVAIWRGGEPVGTRDPDWVWFGPKTSGNVRSLIGSLDHDGDGLGDVVAGSRSWSDGSDGGLAVLHGRSPDPSGLTQVICDADLFYAIEDNSYLGDSLAALPDLDGDGCDEVVAGAPQEDHDNSNQGVVRILWGGGGTCGAPAVTPLAPGLSSAQSGESVAVGFIDGDSWPDLVVGGDGVVENSDLLGSVWVVPGSWLRTLPQTQAPPGDLPDAALQPLVPTNGGHYGLLGPIPTADFAESVAVLPDPARPGQDAVWVGLPDGDLGGGFLGGGALAYRWVDDPLGTGLPGLSTLPFAMIAGESHLPAGKLGDVLVSGQADGTDVLLIGAPTSSQGGVAVGGAYVVPR